jgi:hypothetical protein
MQRKRVRLRRTLMNAVGRRVGAVVILAAIAGCARAGGSGSASDLSGVQVSPIASSPASGLKAGTGTVTGVARAYGGPLMSNGQMADDGSPWSGLTLTATENGQSVASVVTGTDGSYTFTLAPGSYVVTGCADLAVVVVAGQIDHQDIGCPIP